MFFGRVIDVPDLVTVTAQLRFEIRIDGEFQHHYIPALA